MEEQELSDFIATTKMEALTILEDARTTAAEKIENCEATIDRVTARVNKHANRLYWLGVSALVLNLVLAFILIIEIVGNHS